MCNPSPQHFFYGESNFNMLTADVIESLSDDYHCLATMNTGVENGLLYLSFDGPGLQCKGEMFET